MRLYVYVLEGRDWAAESSYVRLQVGKFKSKTRVLRNTARNPVWNEEFLFRVHDLDDQVVVSVYHHDEGSGFLNVSGDLVGRLRIPMWSVVAEENQSLPPTWFSLTAPKTSKSINKDLGKILLTLSLHGRGQESSNDHLLNVHHSIKRENSKERVSIHSSPQETISATTPLGKSYDRKHLVKALAGRLERLFNKGEEISTSDDSSEVSTILSENEDCTGEPPTRYSFEESINMMESTNCDQEMLENLQGGILIDQKYMVSSKDLNMLLFTPNSPFMRDLAELQGTMDVKEGPWTWKSEDKSCLVRVVTYTKAATKLIKAVKAAEEQTYIKADGREFAVFVSVSTPDVPYGNAFKVKLLYKISPGPELSSGEESSHLLVSWGVKFYQGTMMKGMIERGAQQGLKESFDQFSSLLSQNLKVLDSADILDKDQVLASVQTVHQSDRELATQYFCNFTVISTVFMVVYIVLHIMLYGSSKFQGLEFYGLDLPDTLGELITCGIVVIQLQRVHNMVSHFIQARLQIESDHGVKAEGDGWVLTVALIEGSNIASMDSMELPDPYVVFTCNGKTRTSSVKLQTLAPKWNEILEFNAIEEPPSVLDVEVFDFDGPFDQDVSLGHAEINFLKHKPAELAELWVSLEGKIALASQSKLHLRIFLDNTNGVETIREYLTKMEKEVGKKLNLRSPHRNSTFQKIFELPPEEFLISDYSCSLKRRMPLQGRLFLSARIVGFYANLFGNKTKFFLLWEDIEDIQVLPPSLASVGSALLVIIMRKGRGLDARHGAKSHDEEGRLQFHFHSFVSFNVASRTIMALWRTRTLTSDQRAQIAEEQQEDDKESHMAEAGGSNLVVDDAKMSKVYTEALPISVESLMEMFDGGELEHELMGNCGCHNYEATSWDSVAPDLFERRLCYKFSRRISIFGGEVTCTQQKSPIANGKGWIVNEVMALSNVPFGDYFRVYFRYQIEKCADATTSCKCEVYIGVVWLKTAKFQQRITRNIIEKFTHRLKEIFELIEKKKSSLVAQ